MATATPRISPAAELEDAYTFFRMQLSVADLEHLARKGTETPVSGDALMVYSSEAPEASLLCIDCNTITFCEFPHGAGHDHSPEARACSARALDL